MNFAFQRDGVTGEWRVLMTRSNMICTLGPYYSAEQMKKYQIIRANGGYRGNEKSIQGVLRRDLKKITIWET